MTAERRKEAVRSLAELYTVVIGVALSLAVIGVVHRPNGLIQVNTESVCLFFAMLVTLVPFYHGAVLHLYSAYLDAVEKRPKALAIMPDFALLFTHALGFVVLASLIDHPSQFVWALVAIIAVDVVWAVYAMFGPSSEGALNPEGKWSIINAVFLAAALLYLIMQHVSLGADNRPVETAEVTLIACSVRSVVDYVWCKSFYFPD